MGQVNYLSLEGGGRGGAQRWAGIKSTMYTSPVMIKSLGWLTWWLFKISSLSIKLIMYYIYKIFYNFITTIITHHKNGQISSSLPKNSMCKYLTHCTLIPSGMLLITDHDTLMIVHHSHSLDRSYSGVCMLLAWLARQERSNPNRL